MNALIVGFGKIGKIRYEIIRKKNFIKKIFFFDPNQKKINKNQNCLKSLKSLENYNIDIAFVCVPTYLAASITESLILKNINVFCEKPPSVNSGQLLKLKKILKKRPKVKLMYGFNHRYHPSIIKILEIINSKEYGNILWIRARYGKPIDKNYIDGWRGKIKKSGGGILIDQGIHILDLLVLFLGKIKRLYSILNNNFIKKNIEDNAFIILENYKKQSGSLHSTLTQWRHLFAIEIFFEKGFLVLNGLKTPSGSYGDEILTYGKNSEKIPKIKWNKIKKIRFKRDISFYNETNHFLNMVLKNKKIHTSNIDDAINVMKILEKIYKQNAKIFI